MKRLKTYNENPGRGRGLDVKKLNAFKALKDESRVVGRIVGL